MDPKTRLAKDMGMHMRSIYKDMLMILEDLKQQHDFHFQKLYENLPPEYHPIINTADHFTEDQVKWIRKRILDVGNDSIREGNDTVESYQIEFKFNKD